MNNPLARLAFAISDVGEGMKMQKNLEQIDHLIHKIANVVKKMSQVRRYQVQNYCGGFNSLDLDASSRDGG